MPFETIVPEPFRMASETFAFSPAVRAGDWLIVSGQVGIGADMTMPEDLEAEFRNVFAALGLILDEAGASFDDIVELQCFHVTDTLAEDLALFNKVRGEYITGPHPATTTLGVESIIIPGARIEVRAQAYLGA